MANPCVNCAIKEPDCPKGAAIPKLACDRMLKCIDTFVNRDKRAPQNKGGGTHGLTHRFKEQVEGRCGPGTKSWQDHEDQIRGLQNKLASYVNQYLKKCLGSHGPLTDEILELATRPIPKAKDWKGDRSKPVPPECNRVPVPVPQPVPSTVPQPAPAEDRQPDSAPRRGPDGQAVATALIVVGAVALGAAIVLAAPAAVTVAAVALIAVGVGGWFGGGGGDDAA